LSGDTGNGFASSVSKVDDRRSGAFAEPAANAGLPTGLGRWRRPRTAHSPLFTYLGAGIAGAVCGRLF
jgi:hypothetical protein